MSCRIGIDVGGTFTDFVLVDRRAGRMIHHKEPSTPSDPAASVEAGIAMLLANAGVAACDVEFVSHGTTIALNAILQRRGAAVALIVSPGNQDILEIARLRIANSYSFFAMREAPLVPRDWVIEFPARLNGDGSVHLAPSEDDLDAAAASVRSLGADAVGITVMNAYLDPPFEADLARRLKHRLGDLSVEASTGLWPEMREYERAMIVVMNAYVAPIMQRYYDRLKRAFGAAGLHAPLFITANNGGTIDLNTARSRPIDSILSGPASGVVAAIDAARAAGVVNIVTFDMGGTSTDIAVAQGQAPEITTRTMIGEIPLILPVVNIAAIGAGGGSIVKVDAQGVLKVGPGSAGSDPGPACYNLGGADATITDCYLMCGLLDAGRFLGGRLRLSEEAARMAVGRLAVGLGFTGADGAARSAEAALRVASSMMATEIRKIFAERGADPRDFVLVSYGGAGPTHAAMLALDAGVERILVPASPGTFCALGGIIADLRRDFVQSCRLTLGRDRTAELGRVLAVLVEQAQRWGRDVADRVTEWRFEVSADMRYPGQAFALIILLPAFQPGSVIDAALTAAFHAEHHRLYGFDDTASEVEISRVVLSAIGVLPRAPLAPDRTSVTETPRFRAVYFDGRWHDVSCVGRVSIAADPPIAGPLLVDQPDTTIFVPPGWTIEAVAGGSLLMRKIARDGA